MTTIHYFITLIAFKLWLLTLLVSSFILSALGPALGPGLSDLGRSRCIGNPDLP